MKKLSILIVFFLWVSCIYAQTDSLKKDLEEKSIVDRTIGKNEIKLNFLYSCGIL